jgi:hypothetical protein
MVPGRSRLDLRSGPDFVEKVFLTDERNFSGLLMLRFTLNRPLTSVVALKSDAAAEKSKDQLSRDL